MSETPTGLPKQLPHPVSLAIIFIALVILSLIVLRIVGYFPKWTNEPKGTPDIEKFTRVYIPLGAVDNKLYYYDRTDEKVCEYQDKNCKERGAIPSVEAASISPDLKKIALLTTKDSSKSGIYVLDFSATSEAPLTQIVKLEFLPPGYSFQSNSYFYWSPESKQIVFVAYKDQHADIFVVPIPPNKINNQSVIAKSATPALSGTFPTPNATLTSITPTSADQQSKRIEPIRNPGSKVGAIIWRGEQSLIFVTDLDGKDAMYEVGNNGGGIVRLKPN